MIDLHGTGLYSKATFSSSMAMQWQTHFTIFLALSIAHHAITEKLTSGYKAWKFLLYLYGLGPGLLYGLLPGNYYTNFCKLVRGIRLMHQHKIMRDNVCKAHLALASFVQEFEIIYCQRKVTCIHFVHPCVHSVVYLPKEVIRVGLPICSSQ